MTYSLKSSKKRERQILGAIPESEADELLTDLANLDDSAMTGDRPVASGVLKRHEAAFRFIPANCDPNEVLWRFRYYLRQAWTADQRARDWYLLRAREVEARYRAASMVDEQEADRRNVAIEKMLDEVPATTPLEAALFHLQQIAHKTRRCANLECSNPYFIIAKKGQRYCSPECAQPARRESKRRWWRENQGEK